MIARDSSCRKDLLWDLQHGLDGPAMVRRCQQLALSGSDHHGLLWTFISPDEHQVVIVVRTGRVQLRMSPVTPVEERCSKPLTGTATGRPWPLIVIPQYAIA